MTTSTFNARNADAYESFMGRWSAKLAAGFASFAGVTRGDRLLDVGCGTGNLARHLSDLVGDAPIVGVDLSEIYLAAAREKVPRATFQPGDATALPFPDAAFDKAMSMLVLQFVPQTDKAVQEMRRVVRPGGVVAAAVWNSYGAMTSHRMFWDVASALGLAGDKHLADFFFRPMTGPGELAAAFSRNGLGNIEQSSVAVSVEYKSFEDFWAPIRAGEASLGKFAASLVADDRERLGQALFRTYCGGRPDGRRSFTCSAWVCKGTV